MRKLISEWLDELPAEAPAAMRSRRDLQRLNAWMGHAALLRCSLGDLLRRDSIHLVELGAGDGSLLRNVVAGASQAPGSVSKRSERRVTFIDRQPVITAGTRESLQALGWLVQVVTADVGDWFDQSPVPHVDALFCNLFLHHFAAEQLESFFGSAAKLTERFIALEPRRSRLALGLSRLVGVIGCGPVTRHDAPASVLAGFSGRELSAMWPANSEWRLEERRAGFASHLFIASRSRS